MNHSSRSNVSSLSKKYYRNMNHNYNNNMNNHNNNKNNKYYQE